MCMINLEKYSTIYLKLFLFNLFFPKSTKKLRKSFLYYNLFKFVHTNFT